MILAHDPPNDPAAVPRLFIALWPDAALRAELAARRDAWAWPPRAAPVPDDKLHLTLHFIGNLEPARVDGLRAAIGVPLARFELALQAPQLWPGGIALLAADAPAPLVALHAALARALVAQRLPVEQRPYRPHVTLARRAHGARPPAAPAPLRWPVGGYALVESASGRYRVLERYGLRTSAST